MVNSTALSGFLSGLSGLFGDAGKNFNSSLFGVPVDQLRNAGQSSTTDEQKLSLQNQSANNAANSQYQTQTNAAKEGSNIDSAAYTQKKLADYNFNQLTKEAPGGSTGVAGYSDGLYNYTPQIGGSPYMPTVTMQQHLNPQVAIMQLQNQMGQQDAQNQFQRNLATSDHDRYNQGIASDQQYQQQSNLQSRQLANQQDIAQIDANSRLGAAAIGAQGSVLGSLFGSVSGGAINGRYW